MQFRVRYMTLLIVAENTLSASFENRVAHYIARVADALDKALPPATQLPKRLHDAMRYAVFNGGKRVRPLLVYATGECLGLDETILDAPATAIELIHAFSLVHDDLPAMDDDDIRRGKPTLHRQFDEATAILAGDALQALAFEILAADQTLLANPRQQTAIILRPARACGASGMAGGHVLDLPSLGRQST